MPNATKYVGLRGLDRSSSAVAWCRSPARLHYELHYGVPEVSVLEQSHLAPTPPRDGRWPQMRPWPTIREALDFGLASEPLI